MIGLLAAIRIHPHLVGPFGMRIRYAFDLDVVLTWDAVAAVKTNRRSYASGRKVQLEPPEAPTTLNAPISSTTNVEVILRGPTTVRLPNRSQATVTRVNLYADDPRGFVAEARKHLAERRSTDASAA